MRLWQHVAPWLAANSNSQQQPLRESQAAGISHGFYNHLLELAKLVDISYCVNSPATEIDPPFQCPSWCREFPNYQLINTWNTGPLFTEASGYVAVGKNATSKNIIVAFRGTYNLAGVIADLNTLPQPFDPCDPPADRPSFPWAADLWTCTTDEDSCKGCTVHTGFQTAWQIIRKEVINGLSDALLECGEQCPVVFAGHSLGAAVALLAYLDLASPKDHQMKLVTFGQPRVGNDKFARWVDQRLNSSYVRVTHAKDPVPLLPPSVMGYTSNGHELFISKNELRPNPEDFRVCHGSEDLNCTAGGEDPLDPGVSLYGHRDYMIRMGLCLEKDDDNSIRSEIAYAV